MLKIAVLGLGKFGMSVARTLCRGGAEVLAVDRSQRLVAEVEDEVSVAVAFDATEAVNLKAYDIGSMDAVIVAIGANFESSVLVAMQCKSLGVPTIYAKALNSMQEAVLRRVGADHVVKPEEDMGHRLSEHILHDSVVDFVELPEGFSLRRVPVPADWVGRSLAELGLLSKHHLNLVQIIRPAPGDETGSEGDDEPLPQKIPLPDGAVVLRAGDLADVIGPDKALAKLAKLAS